MSLPAGFALPAALPVRALGEALIQRICSTAQAAKEPAFRATGTFRFDDPQRTYRTLYCAPSFGTCFLEILLRSGGLVVRRADYDARSVALLLLDAKRLQLIDLFSTAGTVSVGLNLSVLASASYADTQALSALVHAHPQQPHGIVYRSRFDPDEPAIVLFGRSSRMVRLFPNTAPEPLTRVNELDAAVRNRVPFILV